MARPAKNRVASPILKWAGGKSQLLPEILARVPEKFGCYHEPFLGGGAVYFALWNEGRIRRAHLSDVNDSLIELYTCVRDRVSDVVRRLRGHSNEREYFYKLRSKPTNRLAPATRAARMVYLNKTCFNGLYRVNSKGQFNVPFGRNAGSTICDAEGLRLAARALSDARLHAETFDTTLRRARKGDFVYFDPPYRPLSKTAYFTSYSRDRFDDEDQERLAMLFAKLARKGVHVLLSNSDTPEIRKLYESFHIETVQASRLINSRADKRGKITELLISGS